MIFTYILYPKTASRSLREPNVQLIDRGKPVIIQNITSGVAQLQNLQLVDDRLDLECDPVGVVLRRSNSSGVRLKSWIPCEVGLNTLQKITRPGWGFHLQEQIVGDDSFGTPVGEVRYDALEEFNFSGGICGIVDDGRLGWSSRTCTAALRLDDVF